MTYTRIYVYAYLTYRYIVLTTYTQMHSDRQTDTIHTETHLYTDTLTQNLILRRQLFYVYRYIVRFNRVVIFDVVLSGIVC